MPSPELVAANTEKADSLLEPNVDIGMVWDLTLLTLWGF